MCVREFVNVNKEETFDHYTPDERFAIGHTAKFGREMTMKVNDFIRLNFVSFCFTFSANERETKRRSNHQKVFKLTSRQDNFAFQQQLLWKWSCLVARKKRNTTDKRTFSEIESSWRCNRWHELFEEETLTWCVCFRNWARLGFRLMFGGSEARAKDAVLIKLGRRIDRCAKISSAVW